MAAPTAILYDGNRIIPAPQLNFSRSHRRSGDQSIVGTEHQVTITGTLVGCKGWDFSSGSPKFYTGNDYPPDSANSVCDKFANLVEMQEELRNLFDTDGDYRWFEVIGCNGLIRKWRARTISLDFAEGGWTDIVPYTIVLGLQTDNETDDDLHIDHTETWDVQFDEESGGIYELSHTLSCQSEEFARDPNDIEDGWKIAKAWIDARLAGASYTGAAPSTINNDYIFTSTGFDLSNYTAYNYTVGKSIDEYGGTYSITETWTLAKDPVFRTWTTSFSNPRDDYATVSVEGEFRSLIDRVSDTETDPTNGDAALTAFNTWDAASGAYTAAAAVYSTRSGCGTLASCPLSKSVTTTAESRGDGSDAFGEQTRVVQFSYEFSDADAAAEVSISRGVTETLSEACETRVSVSGQIQGHECDCVTDKLTNAQTAYAAIDCAVEAAAVYTGGGTLTLVSSSYTENERDGSIGFSCEFTDKFVAGEIQEERTTVGWTCGDLKTGGVTKTTYTVEGTIRAVCSGSTPSAPSPSTYLCGGAACCELRRSNVTTDDVNKVVTYTYEFDDDCGPGLVEVVVETQVGPENCDNTMTTVNLSVQGVGCDSSTMLTNAEAALNLVTASSYAPGGSYQTSYRKNVNETRGSIQETYTYTTEGDATVEVTITELYDQGNCEDAAYTVEGEIKGRCFVAGGSMAAAEALFANYDPSIYTAAYGCLASSRVSRNEKAATIRWTYEFRDCENGYEHEQVVTTKTDEMGCCNEVTTSGTITPYCDPLTGESGMVATGEAAWASISGGLQSEAQGYCSNTAELRSTNVSRNKKNGVIQYSHTYACCDTCLTGVIRESIQISHEYPADVVAIVPILGRTCGPILQDKGTKTVEKCTVAVDATVARQCGCSTTPPASLAGDVQSLIQGLNSCSSVSYVERDSDSWNPSTGRYTRNITYLCECC
jgi:hypothetical protein